MGIPRFVAWLKDAGYSNVFLQSLPTTVSSFSLDANGILHKVAQMVYGYGNFSDVIRKEYVAKTPAIKLEAEYFTVLASELTNILVSVRPNDIFVIAIDGVAPEAKINQQRKRRFKSAYESTTDSKFDSNCITPGTDFMVKVDKFIQQWLNANKMYRAGDYPLLPDTVIYSSHMEAGEGEHKIMNLIRNGYIKGSGAHVLYGMDADLVVLSMLAPITNVYLMREDIADIVNIEALKFNFQQILNPQTGIKDFCFMSFFIGNDFLPHLLSHLKLTYAFETMFSVYRELGLSLIVHDRPYWPSIKKFIARLAEKEPEMLTKEAFRAVQNPLKQLRESVTTEKVVKNKTAFSISDTVEYIESFDINKFKDLWYTKVFGPKKNSKDYPAPYFTPDDISDMCYKYLVGLFWIYTYYNEGFDHINLSYVYNYHYPPLLTDISALSSKLSTINDYQRKKYQEPLNPVYQLLAVLPTKSKDLLPPSVQPLLDSNSEIADLYPLSAIVDTDGTDAEWRGIVLIPFANMHRIIKAVGNTTILFEPSKTIFITRSLEQIESLKIQSNLRETIRREQEYNRQQYPSHHDKAFHPNNRGYGRGRQYNTNKGFGRGRADKRGTEQYSGRRVDERNTEQYSGRGRMYDTKERFGERNSGQYGRGRYYNK